MKSLRKKEHKMKTINVFIPVDHWAKLIMIHRELSDIIPDFLLYSKKGDMKPSLILRDVVSISQMNRLYKNMLKANVKDIQDEYYHLAIGFVKQKIDSAKWCIGLTTMSLTMEAIFNYQKEYFESQGSEFLLKPMILMDISKITGLDISTISRVSNSKYLQTSFGIFPVKYFFSEKIQTKSGEEVSNREVKKILQECVENESKRYPFNDSDLVVLLQKKGYLIARRTVAKYRELLKIPVATLRKEN
jgi:RNA polymerase sigma-54 factor